MKRLFIIIFAIGMFAFAKLCCQEKPDWSTQCQNQQSAGLPIKR